MSPSFPVSLLLSSRVVFLKRSLDPVLFQSQFRSFRFRLFETSRALSFDLSLLFGTLSLEFRREFFRLMLHIFSLGLHLLVGRFSLNSKRLLCLDCLQGDSRLMSPVGLLHDVIYILSRL